MNTTTTPWSSTTLGFGSKALVQRSGGDIGSTTSSVLDPPQHVLIDRLTNVLDAGGSMTGAKCHSVFGYLFSQDPLMDSQSSFSNIPQLRLVKITIGKI